MATKTEVQQEALDRARQGQAVTNYPAIFRGFLEKGVPEDDIRPRVNIFTFQAWRAQGRTVRRGEHGVKVLTFIETSKEDKETGERKVSRRPWSTTVFHVSQTDPWTPGNGRE